MQIDLDPRGHKVVIFGTPVAARQAVRRWHYAGATVTLVSDPPRNQSALLRMIGPSWLIVHVELGPGLPNRVLDLAGHLRIQMIEEVPAPEHGQVTLVGGGPGGTVLLTVIGSIVAVAPAFGRSAQVVEVICRQSSALARVS